MINRETEEQGAVLRFDQAFERVRSETDRVLTGAPRVIVKYIAPLRSGHGKFIRAASLLACAMDAQGGVPDSAVKTACAIEILHLATLVHDDIIDDADIRRGIPTLQKQFGKKTAVICGDYLLSAALQKAASVARKQEYLQLELPGYLTRLCAGELEQHINNGNLDLTVYRYLRIISGKTAALFEASFFAGAVLAGETGRRLGQYGRLGRHIGMIFQLTDDCMDFEAGRETARKPVQSDYEQGVITLPLIRSLACSEQLRETLRAGKADRAQLNQAVARWGGLDYTRAVAGRYAQKAEKLLVELAPDGEKLERLRTVLSKAMRLS